MLATLFAAACADAPTDGRAGLLPPGVLARLEAPRDTVTVGDHLIVRPIGTDGTDLDPERLEWSSSEPGVVRVSTPGELDALAPGFAEVRAASSGDTATTFFVVEKPPVTARVVPRDTSVHVGGRIQFAGSFLDEDGKPVSGPRVWEVSNGLILAVTNRGLATALSPGEVRVIMSRDSLADTARIVVLPVGAAASVTVMPDSDAALVGDTLQFVADVRDSAGARVYRPVTWVSSDTGVAGIDDAGRLVARALGAASISATIDGVTGATPLRVTDQPLRFTAIVTGSEFSCGLTGDGLAFCWGRGNSGQLGRVAPQQCVSDYAPYFVECSPRPVRVRTDVRFARLFAGSTHACALDRDGAAWCWGSNQWGQLGSAGNSGGDAREWAPVRVNTGLRFQTLSPSYFHTCGVALDGGLWCWGTPWWGQFSQDGFPAPVPVAPERTFTAVAAGVDHTCAVGTDGAAWCWGREGALGSAADSTCYYYANTPEACTSQPLRVPIDEAVVTLAANTFGTCGLTASGRGFCWGWNDYGQAGDGTVEFRLAPATVAGDHRFADLTVGFQYTCGRTAAGDVWCWGRNAGTFGNGLGLDLINPEPIPAAFGVNAASVAAGFEHTCAITPEGVAYCWGRNWQGQVGDGLQGLGRRLLLPSEVRGAR
jgi:alpha-tubulin suppressor-like RCC1 family protein